MLHMRIKNIMLLLILLIFPMSLSIDNVSANESLEVEDIILEALNGDSEVGLKEEVEKELEKLSLDELKLLVDNLSKKENLSSKETTVLRSAEKELENFADLGADHSSLMSVINENLSEDELIKNELDSMDYNSREKLYNKLKEKEDLSNEEKTILEKLEEGYTFPAWKIPLYTVLSVIAFLVLVNIIVKLFS